MLRYQNAISNVQTGLPVYNAQVAVQAYPSGAVVTIYSANDVTKPLATNVVTTDTTGAFWFYAPNGRYQFVVTPPGGVAFTIPDVELFDYVDGVPNVVGVQIQSTALTGTAPLIVASTTVVANLNASLLLGSNWASPPAIGGTAPNTAKFTGVTMAGPINETVSAVASATTPDIWTNTGNIINYTGTVTATGFAAAPQAGARRVLDCAGAAVFTAGANMLIDGVASGNLTVAAGDRVEVLARSTTQFVLRHLRQDGLLDTTVTVASDTGYADNSGKGASTGWVRGAMGAIATAAGFVFSGGNPGYIKFPTWLGSWIVQWGTGGTVGSSPSTAAVTFPITFPTAVRALIPGGNAGATSLPAAIGSGGTTTSGTTVTSNGATPFWYVAIGY